MNFLHRFNLPSCGLCNCTKCSDPDWLPEYHYQLATEYLLQPVSVPHENLDPVKALHMIKYVLEDVMETMNVTQRHHWHQDGTETVLDGPDVHNVLYHLFNAIKNTLLAAQIVPWEYNDTTFLEDAGIDPESITFENFLDDFLSDDKPDEKEH